MNKATLHKAIKQTAGTRIPVPRRRPKQSTMSRAQLQGLITRHGKISITTYDKAARSLRGAAAMRPVTKMVTKIAGGAAVGTKADQVGAPPEGFGSIFQWDRAEEEIVLAVFLNAADDLGVKIEGIEPGDTIEIGPSRGLASFSKADGKFLAGLIGLIGEGAAGVVAWQGEPEAAKHISKATEYAREMFDRGEVRTMRRDTFGVDPGTGHRARAEGGVLVTMPGVSPSYSGNGDHKERWLTGHKPRHDDQRPAHVRGGFFPVDGDFRHNTRIVTSRGPLFLTPWDWKFEDNAGFYDVRVRITRGEGTLPPVE